jgi:hypothetical protein
VGYISSLPNAEFLGTDATGKIIPNPLTGTVLTLQSLIVSSLTGGEVVSVDPVTQELITYYTVSNSGGRANALVAFDGQGNVQFATANATGLLTAGGGMYPLTEEYHVSRHGCIGQRDCFELLFLQRHFTHYTPGAGGLRLSQYQCDWGTENRAVEHIPSHQLCAARDGFDGQRRSGTHLQQQWHGL